MRSPAEGVSLLPPILAARPVLRGWFFVVASLWSLLSAARGQETFSLSFQIQDVAGSGPTNSNGVIEPGEDAMIYLSASFRPSVGGEAIWDTNGGTGQRGTIGGLHFVTGDLLATENLGTGTWGTYSVAYGFGLASPVINPDNSLSLVQFGQYASPLLQVPNPRNDEWFYRARWHPNSYAPRTVQFTFRTDARAVDSPSVLLDVGLRDPQGFILWQVDTWACNQPVGGFTIVPATQVALPLVFAFVWKSGRNRSN